MAEKASKTPRAAAKVQSLAVPAPVEAQPLPAKPVVPPPASAAVPPAPEAPPAPVATAEPALPAKAVKSARAAKVAKPALPPVVAAPKIAEPAAKPAAETQVKPIAAVPPAAAITAKPEAPRASIKELKEKIMASQPTVDTTKITETMTAALGEMQERAKMAYEKSTATVTDMTEFAKGNMEAMVESGKILAGGMQDMSKLVVEEAKSAYETATADIKEMAAIKSPTELFQLQGRIARRNFDALMATSSKNAEAMMKLASDVFAPLSGRVNVAVEKISRAA